MSFSDDLKSRDINLYPVVVINDSIYISTNSTTFQGNYCKPILENVPSLKESIDLEKRNYRISNITLSINNFEVSGERFSDTVGNSSLINQSVDIYWVSPSDFYQVYKGWVLRYDMDDEKVKLTVEDRSQKTLHKDLPLDNLGSGDIILDKYKNVYLPMAFGPVEKSPCVIDTRGGQKVVRADTDDDSGYSYAGINKLYLVNNGNYLGIPKEFIYLFPHVLEGESPYGYEVGSAQWSFYHGRVTIENNLLLANDMMQVTHVSFPHDMAIKVTEMNDPDLSQTTTPTAEDAGNLLTEQNINDIGTGVGYTSPEEHGIQMNGTSDEWHNWQTAHPHPPFSNSTTYLEIDPATDINYVDAINIRLKINGYEMPSLMADDMYPGVNLWLNLKDWGITLHAGRLSNGHTAEATWTDEHLQDQFGPYFTKYSDLRELVSNNGWNDLEQLFYMGYWVDYYGGTSSGSFGNTTAAFRNNNWFDLISDPPFPDDDNQYFLVNQMSKFVLHVQKTTYKIYIGFSFRGFAPDGASITSISKDQYNLNSIEMTTLYDIDKPLSENFYADVYGRGYIPQVSGSNAPWTIPTLPSIMATGGISYDETILSALGLNPDIIVLPSEVGYQNWEYAFTVNKKINSKKLIEQLASASPYLPRFDYLGNFKFDVIKQNYYEADIDNSRRIKKADVISFSYSRTKIEDVFTKIELKYKWSYEHDEFTKGVNNDLGYTVEDVLPEGSGYERDYYGLTGDADSTLLVDDTRGKFIQDDETAAEFAKWLLRWHCNQHLKIKLRLPLNYLETQVGSIVSFDDILGDSLPYGIEYNYDKSTDIYLGMILNGSQLYPLFLVTSTNKTLTHIDLEVIQLHGLTQSNTTMGVIEGCTIGGSWNLYETDVEGLIINDDGSCVNVYDFLQPLCPFDDNPVMEGDTATNTEYSDELHPSSSSGGLDTSVYLDQVFIYGVPETYEGFDNPIDAAKAYYYANGNPAPNTSLAPRIYDYSACAWDQTINHEIDYIKVEFKDANGIYKEMGFVVDNAIEIVLDQEFWNLWLSDDRITMRITYQFKQNNPTNSGDSRLVHWYFNEEGQPVTILPDTWFALNPYEWLDDNFYPNAAVKYIKIFRKTADQEGLDLQESSGDQPETANVIMTYKLAIKSSYEAVVEETMSDPYTEIYDTEVIMHFVAPLETDIPYGDINNDGFWNMLDIVKLVNCVLDQNCGDLAYPERADVNADGEWNMLDIVKLVNCVLAQNCEDVLG